MNKISLLAAGLLALSSVGIQAAPMMSADWTAQACDAWNKDATLTDGLADKWIANDKKRGYKIIQMYRTDCGEAYKTGLKIVEKNSRAMCVYGGKQQTAILDYDVDYLMHATTDRWNEMGAGEYGPMRAMMFGRLKFTYGTRRVSCYTFCSRSEQRLWQQHDARGRRHLGRFAHCFQSAR